MHWSLAIVVFLKKVEQKQKNFRSVITDQFKAEKVIKKDDEAQNSIQVCKVFSRESCLFELAHVSKVGQVETQNPHFVEVVF